MEPFVATLNFSIERHAGRDNGMAYLVVPYLRQTKHPALLPEKEGGLWRNGLGQLVVYCRLCFTSSYFCTT